MQALVALPANFLVNALSLLDNKFSKEKCLLTTLGIFLEFLSRNAFLSSVFVAILRNVASVVQWPLRPLSGLLLRGALLPRFDTFHQAAKVPQRLGSPREMLQIEKWLNLREGHKNRECFPKFYEAEDRRSLNTLQ